MTMAFVKMIVLGLISPIYLSDQIRGSDSALPKLCVCTVLVNLLPRHVYDHLIIVPEVHTSIRVVSPSMGLLPWPTNEISAHKCRVVEAHVQYILQDHVRLSHAQYLLNGFHFLPSIMSRKGSSCRKSFSKIQHFFSCSFHLNNNLHETINIRL